MYVVGLTGGIGSGKSTAATIFSQHGITVIDTDQLARTVTLPDQPAFKIILAHFGPSILQANGCLNRAALRKIIFSNDKERIWLEKLLHPLIRDEMKRQAELAKSSFCVVVIPLLFETEPNPLINRILVIDAPEDEQIKRTQIRDRSSKEEVEAILRTQVSREKRLAAADDVIENNGSFADLESKIEKFIIFIEALLKKS